MQIHGHKVLPADRGSVWEAFNDPVILQRCLPGCEGFVRTSPHAFRTATTARIGPLRARIAIELALSEIDPGSWRLNATAHSPIGGATATAAITLVEASGATELSYVADASLRGKLALFAGRGAHTLPPLLDGFFARLAQALRERSAADSGIAAIAPEAIAEPLAAEEAYTPQHIAPFPRRKKLWIGIGTATAIAVIAGVTTALRRR